MPQTLLSLLALAAAAFFTLGQKQGSTHTMESIVTDEFEVAVAGSLLQTTEFADSRSFDDATTPERLRIRLGLPQILTQATLDTLTLEDVTIPTSQFAALSRFGLSPAGTLARCDARNQPASVDCDDVSDLNDRKTLSSKDPAAWHDVTLTTPNGDPLPVEVHIEVHYVEADRPDVIVDKPTNHKRVDVWARSPTLMRKYPDHTIQMHRVISFNPAVALEYLKRTSCVVNSGQLAAVRAAEAAVATAKTASDAANASVETKKAALATAQATLTARAATVAGAQTTANATAASLVTAQTSLNEAIGWYYQYPSFQQYIYDNYYLPRLAARDRARTANDRSQADLKTAQAAEASAQTAVSSAQQSLGTATAAAATANQTLATAAAKLQTLSQCNATIAGGAPVYGAPALTGGR